MPDPTLLLVDGMAGVYRFFHAIRGLSTKQGVPTNALFGFVRMMQQMARFWNPTHWCVVFDGGTPAHRLALVPEYKANRAPMPETLREQLPLVNAYLETACIPHIRLDGCEADDVIATLATRAASDGGRVLIATSDKDMFQLICNRVCIVSLAGDPSVMEAEDVVRKTGVLPEQIPDWLALTGDAADNIRGIPGVGAKTAARLLTEVGSLGALYARPETVEAPRIRSLLKEHRSVVERNLKMVTLDCNVSGVPAWCDMKRTPMPVKPLLEFYGRYELHAFGRDLQSPELF